MTIRTATPHDIDDVYSIEHAYIDCPWTREQIADGIEQREVIFLVAEADDGMIVGYASCDTAAGCCDINNIAVHASYRRKGIARALMTALFDKVKAFSMAEAVLTVCEDNAPAISLYESFGFRSVHVRRGYYCGKNGIVMIKKF